MVIHVLEEDAFVEISENYLLYIGSKEEVKGASNEELLDLINNAKLAKQLESMGGSCEG